MKTIEQIDFEQLSERYCATQVQDRSGLLAILIDQKRRFNPEGWMLLQCVVLDSSRLGEHVILPYGPNNTFKEPPDRPISPRGLASDMSEVVAVMPADRLPV